jgi:hypothetical protein
MTVVLLLISGIVVGAPMALRSAVDNGEKVRVAFALDCCDREAMRFLATIGHYRQRCTRSHAGGCRTPLRG